MTLGQLGTGLDIWVFDVMPKEIWTGQYQPLTNQRPFLRHNVPFSAQIKQSHLHKSTSGYE